MDLKQILFVFQLGEVSPTIINAAKHNYLPTESSGEKQELPETWMWFCKISKQNKGFGPRFRKSGIFSKFEILWTKET